MSTRGRGSNGRGRGRRDRGPFNFHVGDDPVEVPRNADPGPSVQYEEGVAPTEFHEHPLTPNDEGQSSHAQNSIERRTRGEIQGSHAPNDRDSRTLIQPFHDRFIPELTTRRVMEILRKHMGPWPTWEQVPREKKEFLYEKFREHFRWLPEHEASIRHSWEQTHKRNFKNTIYRYKKKAMKEVNVDDPMEIQRVVPKNMSSNDWEAICKGHMSAPNYQEKCRKARQNRLTEKDGSITKYTGGSISFAEHARRLAQNGRVVSQVKLHDRTQRKRKGHDEYVDNKSKRAREEYEREYNSQHDSSPTTASSRIEVNDGPCKGRDYDLGNTYHRRELVVNSTENISRRPPPDYVTEEQLQETIARVIDKFSKGSEAVVAKVSEAKAAVAKKAEEIKKLDDEEAKLREETMKTMKFMMNALGAMMAQLDALQGASSSIVPGGEGNKEGKDNTKGDDKSDN